MNHSDIEHMAQGSPPSSIGKDHEEVVTFLATSLLAAQQKLDAVKALAGVAGEMNGVVKDGFAEVVAQRDALAAENAAIKSAIVIAKDELQEHYDTDGVDSEDNEGSFMDACIRLCDAQSTVEKLESIATPATDAYLNSVRADAVQAFWDYSLKDVGRVLGEIRAYDDASRAAGIVYDEIKERVEEFAAQLRSKEAK